MVKPNIITKEVSEFSQGLSTRELLAPDSGIDHKIWTGVPWGNEPKGIGGIWGAWIDKGDTIEWHFIVNPGGFTYVNGFTILTKGISNA